MAKHTESYFQVHFSNIHALKENNSDWLACVNNAGVSDKALDSFDRLLKYGKARTFLVEGRGRFTHCIDMKVDICALCKLFGIKYMLGNDAPRGGKTGYYIATQKEG